MYQRKKRVDCPCCLGGEIQLRSKTGTVIQCRICHGRKIVMEKTSRSYILMKEWRESIKQEKVKLNQDFRKSRKDIVKSLW